MDNHFYELPEKNRNIANIIVMICKGYMLFILLIANVKLSFMDIGISLSLYLYIIRKPDMIMKIETQKRGLVIYKCACNIKILMNARALKACNDYILGLELFMFTYLTEYFFNQPDWKI